MLFHESAIFVAINIAIASVVCSGISIVLSSFFPSLPKRHAALATGLVCCLAIPALVAAGWILNLGVLPTVVTSRSESVVQQPHNEDLFQLALNDGVTDKPASKIDFPNALPLPVVSNEPAQEIPPNVPVNSKSLLASIGEQTTKSPLPTFGGPDWPAKDAPEATPASKNSSRLPFSFRRVASVLIWAWLIGIAVFAVLRVRDWLRCRALLKSCSELIDEQSTAIVREISERILPGIRPRILVSSQVTAPVVAGVVYPRVVLPADFSELFSVTELRSVVAHELAHIRRKDHWLLGIQAVVTTWYWWNPFVHAASSWLSQARELICDDVAVQSEGQSRVYARTIIAMAERAAQTGAVAMSLGIGRSALKEMELRIHRIVAGGSRAPETQLSRKTWRILLTVVGLFFSALPFVQTPTLSPTPMVVTYGTSSEISTELQNVVQDHVGLEETKQESSTPEQSAQDVSQPENIVLDEVILGDPKFPAHEISGQILDENGQPAAGATIRARTVFGSEFDQHVVADALGRFQATVHIRNIYVVELVASDVSGAHMAYYKIGSNRIRPPAKLTEMDPLTEIEIRLEEQQQREVEVVDVRGEPIENASVLVGRRHFGEIIAGKTDREGKWTYRLPISMSHLLIAAWKDGEGLDYRLYYVGSDRSNDLTATAPGFSEVGPERLVLSGVAPLTVTVVDENEKPLEGVDVHPWYVQKVDQDELFNLSGTGINKKTNSDGQVTFDWFPEWQLSTVTVWANATGFDRPRGIYNLPKDKGQLTIKLQRMVPIRGRVMDQFGNPVPNIEVAYGGPLSHEQLCETVTDQDGMYKLMARPGQECIVVVRDSMRSAKAKLVEVIEPLKPVEGCDFQIAKTTRVFGKILNSETGKPVMGNRMRLVQYYKNPDDPEQQKDVMKNDWPSSPSIWRQSGVANEEGEFEFNLGPGVYRLSPNDRDDFQEFVVNGEAEIEIDFKTDVGAMAELNGQAVAKQSGIAELIGRAISKTDGTPVSGARVLAANDKFSGDRWEATTDADGRFKVPMREEPGLVQVFGSDAVLASILKLDGDERDIVVELEATGKITGRLLDENRHPIANQRIYYGSSGYSNHYGGFVVTDALGTFSISGVAPNWDYSLKVPRSLGDFDSRPTLKIVRLRPGETINVGDLTPWPKGDFQFRKNR